MRTADGKEGIQISPDIKLDALIPGCLDCLLHCLLYCLCCNTNLLSSAAVYRTAGAASLSIQAA